MEGVDVGLNKVFRMKEIRTCLKADENDLAERKDNSTGEGMPKFGPFEHVRNGT